MWFWHLHWEYIFDDVYCSCECVCLQGAFRRLLNQSWGSYSVFACLLADLRLEKFRTDNVNRQVGMNADHRLMWFKGLPIKPPHPPLTRERPLVPHGLKRLKGILKENLIYLFIYLLLKKPVPLSVSSWEEQHRVEFPIPNLVVQGCSGIRSCNLLHKKL